jgi:hypothetical protein
VLVKEAIDHVRMSYPHWNASEGADHFMVFSYDHARCDQARPRARWHAAAPRGAWARAACALCARRAAQRATAGHGCAAGDVSPGMLASPPLNMCRDAAPGLRTLLPLREARAALERRECARQAKALRAEDFGQLFSIQAFGSLTYRRAPPHTGARSGMYGRCCEPAPRVKAAAGSRSRGGARPQRTAGTC